ncbi:probable transcription factor At3g04930 [Phalaenopsis equestris]|uniref:probable transcription factor At3g04930 n=1 Tax=Phalaenopsis equestris TaxID=78828 RepID=UPI0009E32480|nr:probable transcription factor At3g04930 [Phalaenopsis equestris]
MPSAGEDDTAAGDDEVTDSEEMIGISDHIHRQIANTSGGEESRRMFQKLWTHADEMKVLQGFLEFTSKRGTTHANYQHDTGPFFNEIRPRLQFDFNKNQIAEKLRRLKKKYRNAAAKIGSGRGFVFKSPHDRATYEISRKIWSTKIWSTTTFYRKPKNRSNQEDRSGGVGGSEVTNFPAALDCFASASPPSLAEEIGPVPPPSKTEDVAAAAAGQSVEEEAVRICLAPVFKELVQFAVAGATTAPPIALAVEGDERWRQQRIMELELYLKRMELVEEWVRSSLEKLRSLGS